MSLFDSLRLIVFVLAIVGLVVSLILFCRDKYGVNRRGQRHGWPMDDDKGEWGQ